MLFGLLLLVPTKSCCQHYVGRAASHPHPHLCSATPPGTLPASHRHPSSQLLTSVYLHPEGKRWFLLAGFAFPLVVFCLLSNCRPALAQGNPRDVPPHTVDCSHTFNSDPISAYGGSPLLSITLPSYSSSVLGFSLAFSLLLSR